MKYFGRLYLDKEKDMIVDLYRDADDLRYILRTPNHNTGNLITNLAKLCSLPLSFDENGLKIIEGTVPSYVDAYNNSVWILRIGDVKIANIYPDGSIERKAAIPSISKTLMSQTKNYKLGIYETIIKSYIFSDCKFRTDLHTHMNANLSADTLIALGIRHQIRYPLYYIKKLDLRITEKQRERLMKQREKTAVSVQGCGLTGKYLTRRIDDNTFINFADLILSNTEDAEYNLARIRSSLAVIKDGQAVFTNLEKVYLYRYVFTKGVPSGRKISLKNTDRIPDADIRKMLDQMLEDSRDPRYKDNTIFQDKLLWIARMYKRQGVAYAEISDTTLVKKQQSVEMLRQIHEVMPHITAETGVLLRFLAGIRRVPLTIIRDNITKSDYLQENLQVIDAVRLDPYVAGSDFIGEEVNDIRELRPVIKALVSFAKDDPSFVIRIHAGENDSLKDNVFNSVQCVIDSLDKGQKMPCVRIGHGLYAANLKSARGRQLLKLLKEHNVTLEFQITSNVRLNNLSTMDNHPLKQYLRAGVRCVQGTDGSAIYGSDPMDEQLSLERLLKLTHEDMIKMHETEEDIIRRSLKAFRDKEKRLRELAGDEDPLVYIEKRIGKKSFADITVGTKQLLDSSAVFRDRIRELPADKFPVIVAGGSFNNDRHQTRLTEVKKKMIDTLLEKCDPEKVFFVIGDKLRGYEKYLLDQNRGRFEVYAVVTSGISREETNAIEKTDIGIRVSIEASSMGLYKSFAYEIFKRRVSMLMVFDGNSAGANMIQEAKMGKKKCRIFVSGNSRMLRNKAQTLQGYVTLFTEKDDRMGDILAFLDSRELLLKDGAEDAADKG
ncbi:MAG: hypothetical protein K6G61_01480 [Solobacterium sp.]|nr:hypothetical protein [Solobacterium sp.]